MHPIIHLFISLGVGYAITGGAKNGKEDWILIIAACFLQGCLDLDFIFPSLTGVRYLHNLMITFNLPIIIFVMLSMTPVNKTTSMLRRGTILFATLAIGHLLLDMWTGGTYYFLYPVSEMAFSITLPSEAAQVIGGITTNEMILLGWGATILMSKFYYPAIKREETMYNEVEDILDNLDQLPTKPHINNTGYGTTNNGTTLRYRKIATMPKPNTNPA